MNVLVIDIGGTRVKILATGQTEKRAFESGPTLTPARMVVGVKTLAEGWAYDVVSVGYPGPVLRNRPVAEPHNLAKGWVGFDFEAELVSGGKGLSNQIRRAQAIGAEIRWTSDRSGTRLTLWLPYHRGSDEPSKTTASEERSKKASAPAPQPATVQYR